MDTITTIQSLLTLNGSARPVMVSLTPDTSRLIASAPDLLEACKESIIRLTDLFNRHERPTYLHPSNANSDLELLLATCRNAIQKTEGAE